jgi:hypothetical protein
MPQSLKSGDGYGPRRIISLTAKFLQTFYKDKRHSFTLYASFLRQYEVTIPFHVSLQ